MLKLSRLMAYLGGLMLIALILMACVSIVGRSLNGVLHSDFFQGGLKGFADWALALGIGPINGDFELIEAGIAFSIFSFLPLCQISGGHATVDIFTSQMSDRANRILRVIIDILFAAVIVLIAVQLLGGMQSKMRSGQTTLLIQFPVWWAYAPSVVGAAVAAIISIYIAVVRLAEAATGQAILPADLGADH
ncbi:TRAP transporter small permease [Flavimaricola marinus]|nr:TRAP transporter small permease [Flavimaricola marinus]